MYQIKTDSRLEIQVRGNLCTILDAEGREQFAGDWDDCLSWLAARGIKIK